LSLQEIIAKALNKDLEERYQSASEMRTEIASLARSLAAGAEDPEKSNPPSDVPREQSGNQQQVFSKPPSTSSRIRWIRFILAGCVVIIGGAATWWGVHAWMRPKQPHAAVTSKTFPLGTFRGGVGNIAFSPDDRQIAFTWGDQAWGNRTSMWNSSEARGRSRLHIRRAEQSPALNGLRMDAYFPSLVAETRTAARFIPFLRSGGRAKTY
jgi:hypothetical protein